MLWRAISSSASKPGASMSIVSGATVAISTTGSAGSSPAAERAVAQVAVSHQAEQVALLDQQHRRDALVAHQLGDGADRGCAATPSPARA